ncbi:EAL domain-containing protein [bacterium]|nr:EAL domain-containing protein [bacterium]MBU1989786.1 EAL domain-containing protein [bacterium]
MVFLISSLLVLSMTVITLFVVSVVHNSMSQQTSALLGNKSNAIHTRIEQRLLYLIENTALLTKNELMINALTDADGRKRYLPSLVENFMLGKDVLSLNIVDFDGKPIFKTQDKIPLYNESEKLRNALAMGKMDYYIQEEDYELVVVSPIEYYSTTQGAAIVVFDLSKILDNNLPDDKNIYLHLLKDAKTIYSYNFDQGLEYQVNHHDVYDHTSIFYQLGLSLELGMDSKVYTAPVSEVIDKLIMLGFVFITIGILSATLLAQSITKPILKLYKRVTVSGSSGENFCSPLGTEDELEALAKAFDKRTLMLQYQAEHDALTTLPNRVLFIDRLRENIKKTPRHQPGFAVLFLDLDHFKEVNDSFGHDFGDELLLSIGKYLADSLRESDSVARMGGDEFTILLNDVENINTIVPILEKIMLLFSKPFSIQHHEFYITCSLGVAIYPINGDTPELLLKNADAAMYKAKEEGRNNYKFYTDDMTEKAYDRIMLEKELRQAIANREFEVYYQPQVNMEDESIVGMEALVRWNHPQKGLISPNDFIPLAEETRLIIDIDRQVMSDAMHQFQKWIRDGYRVGILSINLSMIQLNHKDFLSFVQEMLSVSKLSADNVMFEVTETQVMKNPENAIILLHQLKALGISLSVDDFGTGHSSLSYLKQLPIDKLKIDQSFTRDIFIDENDAELTRAIISIAKSLRLDVIAEGVETREQGVFLMDNGCMQAQGYLYYKPQNAQALSEILRAKMPSVS